MTIHNEIKAISAFLRGIGKAPLSVSPEFIKENPHLFMKLITACLKTTQYCCEKEYHYGITLTRNPNKDTPAKFVQKALKMLTREWFEASDLTWAFECYNDKGESINEHIHVYAKSDSSLRMNDLKRSYPNNRMDMQKLYGDKIPKTKNYITKDMLCENTIAHYKEHGLDKHHSM